MFYWEDLLSANTLIVFHFQVHYTHVDESSFRVNLIFVHCGILQLLTESLCFVKYTNLKKVSKTDMKAAATVTEAIARICKLDRISCTERSGYNVLHKHVYDKNLF
jgi:hypothetical protein